MQRISIVPVSGTGGSMVIADDQVTSPRTIILSPAWMPAPEIQLQTVMPVRAKFAKVFARGCAVTPYVWVVTRTHASVADAEMFKRDHVKEIVNKLALGQFVLTQTSFGVSMKSVGALKSPRCTAQVGLKTTFTYEWQGTPFDS